MSQSQNRRASLTGAVLLAGTLLSGTLLAGCSLLPQEEAALKPPLVKPAQENYTKSTVVKGTIVKEIKGIGTFESTRTESAQYKYRDGRIEEMKVKAGDRVKKGDVLVQMALDGLDLQLKEQQLALEKAKYALNRAKESPDKDSGNVKLASLQLDIEQLKYNRLQQAYDSRTIISSIDGQVIFTENLEPGSSVAPYQTLVSIADPNQLRISWNSDNAQTLKDAEVGMEVEVKVNGRTITGQVLQTPASAPATSDKKLAEKYARTLYVSAPDSGIEIGKLADLTIYLQKHDNALKIPRSGLRSYLDRNYVQVYENGALRETDVEVGIQSGTEVEIISGLREGQEVVLQN